MMPSTFETNNNSSQCDALLQRFENFNNTLPKLVEEIIMAFATAHKKTSWSELCTQEKLLSQYENAYQLIVDSLRYALMAAIISLLASIAGGILFTICLFFSPVCFAIAAYKYYNPSHSNVNVNAQLDNSPTPTNECSQKEKSQSNDEALKWVRYGFTPIVTAVVMSGIPGLIGFSYLGLMLYKSSNLISACIPQQVKDTASSVARGAWCFISPMIDKIQTNVDDQLGRTGLSNLSTV